MSYSYSYKKAMKRKVDNEICYRELRQVGRSTEGVIEDGLGAAYRLLIYT